MEKKDNSISVFEDEKKKNNCLSDIKEIVNQTRDYAYKSVNIALVIRNWLIGKRIYEEELKGNNRAEYGAQIINNLSKELTLEYGKGFDRFRLYEFYIFYKYYPSLLNIKDILDKNMSNIEKANTNNLTNLKYQNKEISISFINNLSISQIVHSLSAQSIKLSNWTHYRYLISVQDSKAREWYEKESIREGWSVRTLRRNIFSQYYYRVIKTVESEIKECNDIETYETNKYEFIKNPMVLEFLNIPQDSKLYETDLENAFISNLRDTLLELGKGYAFVGRQYHIHTEKNDYYIDLVFYNYILKCFILIDLKTTIIKHKDVGQMDMYVRMFDELIKDETDNPTLGIVLCSETDEDIARYSVLNGNEQLFATKYRLYLPSEEELRNEIERQKELFYQTHKK